MNFLAAALTLAGVAVAQDPAGGWMAYAVGTVPAGTERITRLEMKWKVGAAAKPSFAFYSPWFGMDPADNLNLIQPVNPWSGRSWSMYTEYFQWSPEHNSNSDQYAVQPGDELHGSLVYNAQYDSYTLTQSVTGSDKTSTQVVTCQEGKKFTVPYVVYEKAFPCRDYPPDEIVTFYDIVAECDGKDCATDIKWAAKNYDDHHCDMQAHIGDGNSNISITWDTAGKSFVDGMTDEEQINFNLNGWAESLFHAEADSAAIAAAAAATAPSSPLVPRLSVIPNNHGNDDNDNGNNDTLTLASFDDGKKWVEENDPVMGGMSTNCTFTVDASAKMAVFQGVVEIVPSLKAPGFCFARTAETHKSDYPDVSAYSHMQLLVKSTGPMKQFKVAFAADVFSAQFKSFKADFNVTSPSSEVQTVSIPFSSFSKDWSPATGEPTKHTPPTVRNLKDIYQLQVWAEGVQGAFHLEVHEIRAANI